MNDNEKTREQLVHELMELRPQNAAQKTSMTGSISAELATKEAQRYAESILETVREPLLVLDADLKIISANRNFYRIFKVTPGETIGSYIYDLGNKQWDIPRLREMLEEVLPEKEAFDNFEVDHNFRDIGHKIMLLNARQIYRKDIGTKMILLAIEDITERRKLEEAHNNLAAIVESADDAIICKDLEGIIVSWNRGAEIAYGYNAKEVIGKSISLLMPPAHPDEYKELLTKRSSGELIQNYETQRMRKDGKIVDVSLTISPVKDTSGEITGDSIIARDITERKRLENLLIDSENQYRRLFETASDGIVLLEKREGKITQANPATEKMLGYNHKESIGNKLQDIGVVIDMSDFQTTMKNLNKSGIINYRNVKAETKSGQHIDTEIYLVDRAKLVQCNIRDITERKQLLSLSLTDPLTGLQNRRGFLSLAGQQLKLSDRNKRGVQLYFADLDGLKWINDTLGHEEGDKALIEIATVFRETFRTSDILARLGGDEYAALAVDITEANSEIFTARLQSLIDTRNNQENRRYRLSISVGRSYYDPKNPCSLDELMASADKLMYEQKQNKKGLLLPGASLSNGNPHSNASPKVTAL
ncbi:MAG: PAS domain S-box protein [Deltaproteobacteria bacterium]|nr:PAS domain S-box protein [Deltaproteobacteria bacterium]